MSLIPCGHRIIVKPQKIEDLDETYRSAKTAGIYIPELELRKEQIAVDKGTVIAIGTTAFQDYGGDPWCNVGDFVAYARHGGKLIEDPADKEVYLVLNDEDVICKLTKE